MSDHETHTVDTIYGEAEIEVVECSSCETEIAKAEAEPFTIGEGVDERSGWACDHCASEGPADYPRWTPIQGFGPLVVLLFPVYSAISLNDAFDNQLTHYQRCFLIGAAGALVWVGVLTLLLLVLGGSTAGAESEVPPL
jgi:hypothetical protein